MAWTMTAWAEILKRSINWYKSVLPVFFVIYKVKYPFEGRLPHITDITNELIHQRPTILFAWRGEG
jgi:hypothetical protein